MTGQDWEYHRKEAMEWLAKQTECYNYSKIAYKKGEHKKGRKLSNLSKFYQRKMEEANQIAAKAIFDHNNNHHPKEIIDLHGLFVREAIRKLEDRITTATNENIKQIFVIVGRGLHSVGGPKIKPAVELFARDNLIPFGEEKFNPGCIILDLSDFCIPMNNDSNYCGYNDNDNIDNSGESQNSSDNDSDIEPSDYIEGNNSAYNYSYFYSYNENYSSSSNIHSHDERAQQNIRSYPKGSENLSPSVHTEEIHQLSTIIPSPDANADSEDRREDSTNTQSIVISYENFGNLELNNSRESNMQACERAFSILRYVAVLIFLGKIFGWF